MATEIVDKKKNVPETVVEGKSKGLNTLLWILVAVFFAAAAIGNVYFQKVYSLPIRVVGVVIALVIAFAFAAIKNRSAKSSMAKSPRSASNYINRNWSNNHCILIFLGDRFDYCHSN